MLNCYFSYNYDGKEQTLALLAETIKEAKDKAKSISGNLIYLSYEELPDPDAENSMEQTKYDNQVILPICAIESDKQPFPFNYWKTFILWLAGGTNCRCCLGYRIVGGLALGGVVGYLLG